MKAQIYWMANRKDSDGDTVNDYVVVFSEPDGTFATPPDSLPIGPALENIEALELCALVLRNIYNAPTVVAVTRLMELIR